MRRPTPEPAALGMLCIIMLCGFSQATKPDFSGAWELTDLKVTPAPESSGSAALPPGITRIRQTATTLTIEREAFSATIVYTFALDGSESRNASGAMTMTSRSRWEGSRLVTEGTKVSMTSAGRLVSKFKETRYVDAGKAQIVETIFTDDAGQTMTSRQQLTRAPAK